MTPAKSRRPTRRLSQRLELLEERLAQLRQATQRVGNDELCQEVAGYRQLLQESLVMLAAAAEREGPGGLPDDSRQRLQAQAPLRRLAAHAQGGTATERRAIVGLYHDEEGVRRLALSYLEPPAATAALERLLELFPRASSLERRAIMTAVARLPADPRVQELLQEGLSCNDAGVRVGAVQAAQRGGDLADEVAAVATRDTHVTVRTAALTALLRAPTVPPTLICERGLSDHDVGVRMATLRAARHRHDQALVLPLMRALLDREPAVRQEATKVLSAILGFQVPYDPDVPADQRQAAVSSLRCWWAEARFEAQEGASEMGAGEDELHDPLGAEFLVEGPRAASDEGDDHGRPTE